MEDDLVYLAAIKHDLNPRLFPHDLPFVTLQLQLTLYDWVIAAFVRLTRIPLIVSVLVWQFAGLFVLLASCWRITALCFSQASARWAGTSFVAVILAMPVSETNLFLADQHLHPRLLATDCILLAILAIMRRRNLLAVPLLVLGMSFHPLMTAFGISFCLFLSLEQRYPGWWLGGRWMLRAGALPSCWLWEKPTASWQAATSERTLLYLYKWAWYGWLGAVGPLFIAGWIRRFAQRRGQNALVTVSSTIVVYGVFQLAAAMVVLLPTAPAWFLQFEPMRFLHLIYLLVGLLGVAALGQVWLRQHVWRWALVFIPLIAGMYVDQQEEFLGSPHIEWPYSAPANPWLQAFAWVRNNTPENAYFALDPLYTEAPDEGVHSFRSLAERSMLADAVKDRGVVTHVPHLAPRWTAETEATRNWASFKLQDFEGLNRRFGVDWIIVDHSVTGLRCPYHNNRLFVCEVAAGKQASATGTEAAVSLHP